MFKKIMTGILVVALVFTFGCFTNPRTPEGCEGYVFETPRFVGKGGFQGVVIGPGNYGFSLFVNRAVNVDFRPTTFSEEFKILAKDDLNVEFKFHAVISIEPNTIRQVVEEYAATDWYIRYAKEPFRTFIREAVQKYDSRDIKKNRAIIASEVRGKLEDHFKNTPFKVISLICGNIDYPNVVTFAVEKKLAANQLLEEQEIQKDIATQRAAIRVEEAKGIRDAQRIINSTLTDKYLQHEAIEAQRIMSKSPNHTTVYIPVGTNGIPIVKTIK